MLARNLSPTECFSETSSPAEAMDDPSAQHIFYRNISRTSAMSFYHPSSPPLVAAPVHILKPSPAVNTTPLLLCTICQCPCMWCMIFFQKQAEQKTPLFYFKQQDKHRATIIPGTSNVFEKDAIIFVFLFFSCGLRKYKTLERSISRDFGRMT